MNKGLAHILRGKLADLPWIDLFAGLVYTQSQDDVVTGPNGGDRVVKIRYPVTCDYGSNYACDVQELLPVIPDSQYRGILYFEDLGITARGRRASYYDFESRLRIIVWLNSKQFTNEQCYNIDTKLMTTIMHKLSGNHYNSGIYNIIKSSVAAVPVANASLFGRYTYDEAVTQYLMPPYIYFGIDIATTFSVHHNCISFETDDVPVC